MLTELSKDIYTLEEYYELERNSEEKLEFFDGVVRPFAGSSLIHEDILMNTGTHLHRLLRNQKCSVFFSRLKIKVPAFGPYRYADMSGLCGPTSVEIMGEMEVLTNPQLIVEILGEQTEAFDRGEKFEYYKSIPSFTEYLLIASSKPLVTRFTKTSENEWVEFETSDLDDKVPLPAFGVELLMSEIYLDARFSLPI